VRHILQLLQLNPQNQCLEEMKYEVKREDEEAEAEAV